MRFRLFQQYPTSFIKVPCQGFVMYIDFLNKFNYRQIKCSYEEWACRSWYFLQDNVKFLVVFLNIFSRRPIYVNNHVMYLKYFNFTSVDTWILRHLSLVPPKFFRPIAYRLSSYCTSIIVVYFACFCIFLVGFWVLSSTLCLLIDSVMNYTSFSPNFSHLIYCSGPSGWNSDCWMRSCDSIVQILGEFGCLVLRFAQLGCYYKTIFLLIFSSLHRLILNLV